MELFTRAQGKCKLHRKGSHDLSALTRSQPFRSQAAQSLPIAQQFTTGKLAMFVTISLAKLVHWSENIAEEALSMPLNSEGSHLIEDQLDTTVHQSR